MADIDRHQLYANFLKSFPIESLKDMPLDKYTNLNKDDSFCYWLESRTYHLGSFWGGSSYKFGIYKYNKKPKDGDPRIQSDDAYAWYSKYNKATADDAYALVRETIVNIAELAQNNKLESIDKIDVFGDAFKWKIAFLYSNKSLVPIYKREMLETVAEHFGMANPKAQSTPSIQHFLMQQKGEKDLFIFYEELLSIIEEKSSENDFKKLKKVLKAKIAEDGRFKCGKSSESFMWVSSADGVIGNSDCHYEFCADSSKSIHEKGSVYVELHCEGKNFEIFKPLANIEGVEEFKWNRYGVRMNSKGYEIKKFQIDDLADALFDELCTLDDMVGDLVRNIIQSTPSTNVNYWVYGPGEGGCMWERCKKQSEICIGWDGTDDLTAYSSKEDYQKLLQELYNQPDNSFKNDRLCLLEFTHIMKPGDIVYARKGITKIVGRGVVEGEYFFNEDYDTYKHIHKVRWTHLGEWDAPWQFTQKNLTKTDDATKIEVLFKDETSGKPAYWWLVANPKIWSLNALKVGEKQEYNLYNDNGNKRRIFQNFLDAKVGDIVIGYESTPTKQIVAITEVARESDGATVEFAKKESLLNPIDFSVLRNIPELQDMEFMKNQQGSLYKLTEEEYNTIIDLIREENPIQKEVTLPVYTEEDFLSEVFISKDDFNTLKHLLISKKNIILQGAPGVGKTFSAKRLCYALMGEVDESRVEFVQFHQNYSYEDFIMGYKPTEDGGFTLKRGLFYNFCKRAKNDPDSNKKYFFIIDEINRGNMSKIFGELMMLIEKDYRGDKHAIKLAYSDELFSVPENVYIIGMMNTADRSLAMIDYALRRRFSFFNMRPGFDSEGFAKYMENLNSTEFNKIIEAIKQLNTAIEKDDSLGMGFCIGHSYFCNQTAISPTWLNNVIEYDIIPMLREYWFDNNTSFDTESKKLRTALA